MQRLEPSGEVVDCKEVGEVGAELVVAFIVETLHGRVLEGAVHALDLAAIRENGPPDCFLVLMAPRMVGLGQAVLDPMVGQVIEEMNKIKRCSQYPDRSTMHRGRFQGFVGSSPI